ncbi:hypothetical protein C8R44DRAFT_827232 [Mycena epipterygia]|nr:hypothetical protein C8R44DRAFT_827232 [Mycena epipterygia]
MFLNTILAAAVAVPACPGKGTVKYDKSVPDQAAFPLTQVDLCYDDGAIRITFTAYNEINFFFNPNYTTNDPIYRYTAMEVFIARGTGDPQTYLEFEVSPNNVTFQAFIYNPSKVAVVDTFYVAEPLVDGLTAVTTLDRPKHIWVSSARIPLGFFNVDKGQGKGTQWRMNFFRIITAPSTFPAQFYGAWNQPNEPNFHMTPFFGNVNFV